MGVNMLSFFPLGAIVSTQLSKDFRKGLIQTEIKSSSAFYKGPKEFEGNWAPSYNHFLPKII